MSGTFMLNNRNYTASGNLRLGGGASVVQKTMAEYTALPSSEKMNGSIYKITDKALIYCLDEEYHAYKELTSAQYSALSSAEKNNGTLYVITDEETTAADIEYTSGVSVADKLGEIPTVTTGTVTPYTDTTVSTSYLYKFGKVVWLGMSVKVANPSAWKNIASIPNGFRPKMSLFGVMDNTTSASNVQTAHVNVEPNGNIRLGNTTPTATDTYNFSLCWIIE